jgi:hypothetical protein
MTGCVLEGPYVESWLEGWVRFCDNFLSPFKKCYPNAWKYIITISNHILPTRVYNRISQLEDFPESTLGRNAGDSHIVTHEVKSSVETLLTAGENAARVSRSNGVRKPLCGNPLYTLCTKNAICKDVNK